MGFMNAQMTEKQYWLQIDGRPNGVESIPDNLFSVYDVRLLLDADELDKSALLKIVGDYTQCRKPENIFSAELVFGYGVRSSSPGYMDCTDWIVYTTKRGALLAARQEQRECDGIQ